MKRLKREFYHIVTDKGLISLRLIRLLSNFHPTVAAAFKCQIYFWVILSYDGETI